MVEGLPVLIGHWACCYVLLIREQALAEQHKPGEIVKTSAFYKVVHESDSKAARIMKQTSGLTPVQGLRCQTMNGAFANGGLNTVQGLRLVMPTGTTDVQAAGCDDLGVNHSMLISAPCVAVIPACAQLIMTPDNDSKGWVIALKRGVLGQASQEAFVAVPKWSRFSDPFLREVADTLSALHRAELIDAACADAFADVISVHIAVHYGHCAEAAAPDTPFTRQMLIRLEAFVHEHIAETILVQQLAVLAHMAPSSFAHAFKKVTGNTPHLYVTLERVRFARTMLCQQTPALVDVGACAGFQTQQHFTAVFHRYTGMTPRAYRLTHLKVGT
ncbi:AraC family transcriptional regulator [Paraburkholderia kirstenboschensis]|uniref:AraC family transcriptional regulator n=1 Tax=Paraburkholderia kirstenboschensis TaxID=1245436 RepID=A0ABZ0E847_9BURK|nr:AraC family transcriptional regulator [Paraburkholderia kirstenboschensis]WOD13436.1 AraC family transcriptional regulator [Paraburkholderia kirstenboschensis]